MGKGITFWSEDNSLRSTKTLRNRKDMGINTWDLDIGVQMIEWT